METLVLRDALLLVNAGEDRVVGLLEAGDEIGGEDFAAERIGAGSSTAQRRPLG